MHLEVNLREGCQINLLTNHNTCSFLRMLLLVVLFVEGMNLVINKQTNKQKRKGESKKVHGLGFRYVYAKSIQPVVLNSVLNTLMFL